MNLLLVLFLTTLRSLNDFSNLWDANREGILTQPPQANKTQQKRRYDNFTVYSINVRNKAQSAVFQRLTKNRENFDLWLTDGGTWHIMVNPSNLNHFKNLTKAGRLRAKILIKNVQELIDDEVTSLNDSLTQSFDWNHYQTLDAINNWLNNIVANHSPIATKFTIGTSTEGRKIHGVKISHRVNNPGIFIESHIHAREWITSATATWIINELLTSKNIRVRYMVENYDWYIVPVLNVDGFVYTHEGDRLWRKTRSRHSVNTDCIGVDGNRNYNSHWMENGGATSNPCDDIYAGPFPLSEPEIHGLANYVLSIRNRINLMLAFHSYGQNLLSPFGYTSAKPDNFEDLMKVSSAFSATVANMTYGTKYHNGSTADTLYIASGCTTDWAYEQGIRLSYTIEFRDQGQYGFLLPASKIIPNSEEALNGIFSMIIEADNLGYMNLKFKPEKERLGFDVTNFFRWPSFK